MRPYNLLYGMSHQCNFLYGMSNHLSIKNLFNKNAINGYLSIIIFFATAVCYAGERRTEAIHIKADEMHFDLQSNSSLYKGNVTIKQGTIELSGDFVEIEQSNNVISKIVASGSPARFRQTDPNGKNMQAQSKQIKYFADEDKLVMIGEAKLVQNEQVIESSQISYDTKKQALLAGQQSEQPEQLDTPQRVKMTLTPNTNK